MAETRELEVTDAGLQVTVQDLGRVGQAHLGVPRSGALDEPAHRLANRLVGNPESAATLECLGGRVAFRARSAVTIAVTGAQVPVTVSGRGRDWGNGVAVPAGALVELGSPTSGLRAYVAVSGCDRPALGARTGAG
jgi:allophanate hydrolase subunit 2